MADDIQISQEVIELYDVFDADTEVDVSLVCIELLVDEPQVGCRYYCD